MHNICCFYIANRDIFMDKMIVKLKYIEIRSSLYIRTRLIFYREKQLSAIIILLYILYSGFFFELNQLYNEIYIKKEFKNL